MTGKPLQSVLEWFLFCVSGLNSLIALVLPKQCCQNSAAKMTSSWHCRNSAVKLAASWARLTILAASLVNICQTCSKYGSPSHTWRISGSTSQYDRTRKIFSLYFAVTLLWLLVIEIAYQRLSANPQAAVLLQGLSLLSASNA